MTNHPNRSQGNFTLDIWGGMTAGYLRGYQRQFSTMSKAAKGLGAICRDLDDLGVRAAHPMSIRDRRGRDVTQECLDALEAAEADGRPDNPMMYYRDGIIRGPRRGR